MRLYEALPLSTRAAPGQAFKRLYMFQGGHQSATGRPRYDALLDQFFATTLKGAAPGPDLEPPVITQGRTATAPGEFREEASWPPARTRERELELGRGLTGGTLGARTAPADASYTDTGASAEEIALRSLDAEASWLAYRSEPLAEDTRIAGTPRLELSLTTNADHAHVTPTLVDIAPDGRTKAISRGFLNLRYRNGLEREEPVPPGERVSAEVLFSPQDHTVAAGHRIALVLAGSNVAWAVPDTPAGTRTTVHHGGRRGSQLVLPIAG